MKLKMTINKIKSIDFAEVELPIEKGLYAFTGQNGSGKSTVCTCLSSAFYKIYLNDYFGKTDDDSFIKFELEQGTKSYVKIDRDGGGKKWIYLDNGKFKIKGFFEGSLIYGNRFRNTNYSTLKKLEFIREQDLQEAPDFIRENLGVILHNNKNFYPKLFKLKKNKKYIKNITGEIFYYEKEGKKVSQFHMSTGENLLISILNSLHIRNSDRTTIDIPFLLILDEIELALHPSSLKRLVNFLKKMADEFNYAVYFSTHSLEIVSSIKPENIFFIDRLDKTLEIINPCYPAYATKILYDHTGYDFVVLVEDDLASEIMKRIIKNKKLINNKLIHILPCGGYSNVIDLAQEVVNSNLLGKMAKILMVLDADIKHDAQNYISKNNISNNVGLNYLPIESLEKYLRQSLFINLDKVLFKELDDYVFQQVSLRDIIDEYRNSGDSDNDNNGKKLYKRIDTELRNRNKSRTDIIEMVIKHLEEHHSEKLDKITIFLHKQLND